MPISLAEIAHSAREACDAGACLIQLHVRDGAGAHSLDPCLYRKASAAIRAEVGDELIIQITTESAGRFDIAAQMRAVREAMPEAASCALRELCPDDAAKPAYAAFLVECREAGIWVQHILCDAADAHRFFALRAEGVIAEPAPLVLLALGRYASDHEVEYSETAARAARFVAALVTLGRRPAKSGELRNALELSAASSHPA